MSERTILVTGAGGFLGSRLVEAIHRTGFGVPRGGVRRWGSAARAARFPIDFVLCDIENSAQAKAACQGAHAVVHTAYTDTREAIVDGTKNMLNAALENGVERFVYISSAEAYGPNVSGLVDETLPCEPTGNFYGDAKLEAEQLVHEFQQRGLATTILRPAIIYGPFSQNWTIDLAAKLQSGNWGQFADYGEGICNLVHVDDLVRAILLTIDHKAACGEIFNVVGPERPTWNEYFRRFNAELGLPPLRNIESKSSTRTSAVRDSINTVTSFVLRRFEEPLMRLYLRGGPLSVMMKRVKTKLKTTPSAAELRGLYSRQAELSHEKASRLLGYQPQVDLDSGLRMCHQWLAFHGFLENVAPIARPGEV